MNGNSTPLTQQVGGGMQASAQAGAMNTPMAGGSPVQTPDPSTYGGGQTSVAPMAGGPINVTGTNAAGTTNAANVPSNSPYSSFLTALNQIQAASPIQAIGGVTPPAKRYQEPQPSQAKSENTSAPGVG